MAAWVCTSCTAVYAVGLAACPQCGGTEHGEEGQEMPKISKGDGPSYEPGHGPSEAAAVEAPSEPQPEVEQEPEAPDVEPDPAPAPAPRPTRK